ncbi:four helix bundle protein [Ectopseudomonas mendocina]
MDFERLEVWQRARALTVDVYKGFSECRDYGFRDQITRSALSIPSNIAEGMERGSDKEKCRFMWIAKGSCAELRTQVLIGADIGYISQSVANLWLEESLRISRMLTDLIGRISE